MPVTTFLSHKPVHPDKEIQSMLEELSSITGTTWCAERRVVVQERKGFFGLFKRAPIYGVQLFKSLKQDTDIKIDYSIEKDATAYIGEVQIITAVVNDHDLKNYLYGALGQLTDAQLTAAWFEGTDLGHSLLSHEDRIKHFFQEASELAQACGMEQTECRTILSEAFASNPGSVERTIYTTYFTLHALCLSKSLSLFAIHNKHIGNDLRPGTLRAWAEKYKESDLTNIPTDEKQPGN